MSSATLLSRPSIGGQIIKTLQSGAQINFGAARRGSYRPDS
jgi:hypothetical protein